MSQFEGAQGSPYAVLVDLRGDILLPMATWPPTVATTPVIERRIYPLTEPVVLIGRDPARCRICVAPHRTDVSREHAAITRRGEAYMLEGRGQNGTFVNGERLNGERELRVDDVLGFASVPDLLLFLDPAQPPGQRQLVEQLTPRELEVLKCLAAGASYLAIAESLCISTNTVKSHIKSLFGKLGADKATVAIKKAREEGLL